MSRLFSCSHSHSYHFMYFAHYHINFYSSHIENVKSG